MIISYVVSVIISIDVVVVVFVMLLVGACKRGCFRGGGFGRKRRSDLIRLQLLYQSIKYAILDY